ncbi:MAG TPA: hypothetical protein VEC96_16520 [Anaerolineae bacterium]|nr:hypothetical protein [Anaerolineae bacterium]
MATSRTPPAVVIKVAREQHGLPPPQAICPWCGERGATEPHHWLLKRSATVPDRVLHDPRNVTLLHPHCHNRYGQTEAMVQRCYHHKIGTLLIKPGRPSLSGRPYNITGWIEQLRTEGLLTHVPILPVLDNQEEKLWIQK